MSKLVVVMFPDVAMIQDPIDALKKLRAERHIKLYASTVVARDPNGKLGKPANAPMKAGDLHFRALLV